MDGGDMEKDEGAVVVVGVDDAVENALFENADDQVDDAVGCEVTLLGLKFDPKPLVSFAPVFCAEREANGEFDDDSDGKPGTGGVDVLPLPLPVANELAMLPMSPFPVG